MKKLPVSRIWVAILAASFLIPFASTLWADESITARDLGTLGGNTSIAFDINDRGEIAGWSEIASGARRATLWTTSGSRRNLGTLGGNNSVAFYVNERGQVAGYSQTGTGDTHVFRWTPEEGLVDVTDEPGLRYCYPTGLNDAGQLIGRCEQQFALPQPEDFAFYWSPEDGLVRLGGSFASTTYVGALNNLGQAVGSSPFPAGSSTQSHGFLWTRGRDMADLGAPFGGYHSRAADSNDGGQIVGESVTHTSRFAVLWLPDGSIWDLGGLRGEPFAGASRINERGQVLGWSGPRQGGDGPLHTTLWSGDTFPFVPIIDLGAFVGGASDLNELGQIVGQKGQGAFLWTEDCVMQDLGTLGGLYTSARAVNNRGRIVGSSYTTLGFSHAVLWDSEPLAFQAWHARLLGKVKCLERLRQLPRDERTYLLQKIKNAQFLEFRGDGAAACAELQLFMKRVQDLVDDEVLKVLQGSELVRDAAGALGGLCPY